MNLSRITSFCSSIVVFASVCGGQRAEGQEASDGVQTGVPGKPRNIVFIMADDLGYGDLGCYGATKIATPNIDRLARRGVKFNRAYASPMCTPTRFAIMTGARGHKNNIKGAGQPNDGLMVPLDRPTSVSVLRDAGYRTALIGKWHLGFGVDKPDWNGELKPGPLECGFDQYFGIPCNNRIAPYVFVRNHRVLNLDANDPITGFSKNGHNHQQRGGSAALWNDMTLGSDLTDEAVDFIEKNQDQPFALYFFPQHPHTPIRVHPEFLGTSKSGLRGDFIQELDACVGRVTDKLEELGLSDDTLLLFSSDNGPTELEVSAKELKAHDMTGGLRGFKGRVNEGGVRVPTIATWPGVITPATQTDAMIHLVDVAATWATLVGKPDEYKFDDSHSFAHCFGEAYEGRDRELISHRNFFGPRIFAYCDGRWKIVVFPKGKTELYDLQNDPNERFDVSKKHPEIVDALRRHHQSD